MEPPCGPEALFEILVREHLPGLTAFLRGAVRDAATVDDLCQETLLVAWKTLARFDRTRPFGPWLRGIARNLLLNRRRKNAGEILIADEAILDRLELRLDEWTRAERDTFDERLDGLRDCLAALPEPYGSAIAGHYRDECSVEGLAERFAVTAEAIKKRLQRGRQRLLDCLQRKLAAEVPR